MRSNANTLGVALTRCYFCGSDDKILMNTILTEGRAKNIEAANGKVIDMDPCRECEEKMKDDRVCIIEIDETDEVPTVQIGVTEHNDPIRIPNPTRTGPMVFMKREALDTLLAVDSSDFLINVKDGCDLMFMQTPILTNCIERYKQAFGVEE